MKKQIGDRMKINYEEAYKLYLPMRLPTIIRLDGKTFHTFTRGMERPFDEYFMRSMAELSQYLVKEIQTAQCAYVQSDEISILLHPYKKLDTEAWFANEVQKMVSVSAGLASSWFSIRFRKEAIFDSRVFVLPEAEVVNYFVWRQQDCTRNSITMVAQSLYSHKELHLKNSSDKQEMIFQKGQNWDKYPTYQKRGTVCTRDRIDREIPVFTQDRGYFDEYLSYED
jgi:tRNA(His) guanylyltransferase